MIWVLVGFVGFRVYIVRRNGFVYVAFWVVSLDCVRIGVYNVESGMACWLIDMRAVEGAMLSPRGAKILSAGMACCSIGTLFR